MRLNVTLVSLTAILATAAFAQETTPSAETTQSPPAGATSTTQPTTPPSMAINPARGATMDSVRAKFGAPSQEVPAVGKPPISRWEYPGYVVYFENDRVLHTVVAK